MFEMIAENFTYQNVVLTSILGILVWVVKEQRRHCNLLIKIKTFLLMKFTDAKQVLE